MVLKCMRTKGVLIRKALVFGLSKFHQYLYGRAFILQTDRKPLTTILGQTRGIPSQATTRLQH